MILFEGNLGILHVADAERTLLRSACELRASAPVWKCRLDQGPRTETTVTRQGSCSHEMVRGAGRLQFERDTLEIGNTRPAAIRLSFGDDVGHPPLVVTLDPLATVASLTMGIALAGRP